jgi:hypothetical protein
MLDDLGATFIFNSSRLKMRPYGMLPTLSKCVFCGEESRCTPDFGLDPGTQLGWLKNDEVLDTVSRAASTPERTEEAGCPA